MAWSEKNTSCKCGKLGNRFLFILWDNLLLVFLKSKGSTSKAWPGLHMVQVFSCDCCEISKNTFFTEHLRAQKSCHRNSIFDRVLNTPLQPFTHSHQSLSFIHLLTFLLYHYENIFLLIAELINFSYFKLQRNIFAKKIISVRNSYFKKSYYFIL